MFNVIISFCVLHVAQSLLISASPMSLDSFVPGVEHELCNTHINLRGQFWHTGMNHIMHVHH